jgi:hypothetical protein
MSEWLRRRARLVLMPVLVGLLGFAAAADADPLDKVEVSASDAGTGKDLVFKWPSAVEASANVEGRVLTISFARAFDLDLGHVADVVAGAGRFVRLSSDRKTLSIGLERDLGVAAERSPTGWVFHLTPADAPAQASQAVPAAVPATAPAKPAAATPAKPEPVKLATKSPAKPEPKPDAPPTLAAPELTISQGEGYSRLSFEWPRPTDYTADLVEGELTLRFKSNQEVRLSDLRVNPPKWVRAAEGAVENGNFTVHIKVAPGVSLRHAKDANYIIVDLVGPAGLAGTPTDGAGTQPVAAGETASTHPGAVTAAAPHEPAAALPPAASPPAAAAPVDAKVPAKSGAPDTIKSLLDFNEIDVSSLDDRLKGKPVEAAADTSVGELEPLSVAVAPHSSLTMTVAVEGRTIKLGFPWGEAVPAAAVRRGDRLWLAFARESEIDVSAMERVRAQGVLGADVFAAKGATLIGLKLADHLLATAVPEVNGWTIALGDEILTPTPDIPLERHADMMPAGVAAQIPGALTIANFRDPDVGDDLLFVMAGAPARGFVSTRRFVDFELLAARQGLVVRPVSDGVEVRLAPNQALITKRGGLHLTGTNLISPGSARAQIDGRLSPAEMKFAEWRGSPKVPFAAAHSTLMAKVAAAEDADRAEAEIDLARFLMGRGLDEEALGVLKVASDEAPQIAGQPSFRVLRGVANLLARRPRDAEPDLDPRELPDDPSTALWVAMLASAKEDFPNARINFARAEPAIVRLDNEWQARARLKAAEAGLEINDFGFARNALDLMPSEGLERDALDEAKLLRARLAEVMGDSAAASKAYDALASSPIEPVAVKAQLQGALLSARAGKLKANEAIDRLESLRFEWRGDAIEAEMLLALGQLYAQIGDFRHALTTMRIAVRQFPGTPTERKVYSEMADLFERLFLDGKADKMPPIQALALYFDFKELTPVGPKGDVMIRRLSDHLVAMDLLDQATALLKHQVDNRLTGVARSQVAARLALVQLMNHKPEEALMTINDTRQARLPDDISAQRRLIEARALMELKRYEHALDVLSGDEGSAVDRLRADIYWHAEDWGKAGPVLEAGLGHAFSAPAPLSDAQRFDAMRAAIAYALGNDRNGLARIKEEFSAKMKETPDAHGFAVVTSEPGQGSVELYSLAERFAGIDTLADFLGQLKEKDTVAKIN